MAYTAKTDLTKNALAQALKKYMAKKPFNKITVSELCADCGFNRQTFYYHFQDVYQLLEWVVDREIVSTFRQTDKFSTWQEAGLFLLNYIRTNEALSLCVLHSVGRDSLKTFLYKDALVICKRFLSDLTEDLQVSDAHLAHLAHFYSVSFAALLEDWVSSGMKGSPEEVIFILDTIVNGTARQALERFAAL